MACGWEYFVHLNSIYVGQQKKKGKKRKKKEYNVLLYWSSDM